MTAATEKGPPPASQEGPREATLESIFWGWHRWLHGDRIQGGRQPEQRAHRAELRRASNLDEVALAQGFQELRLRLEEARPNRVGKGARGLRRLAMLAGVGAVVDTLSDDPLPRLMASPAAGSSTSRVSDKRFRRLLESGTDEERFQALRRNLILAGRTARARNLVEVCIFWNPKTRREWAYDYYRTAPKKEND